MLFGFVALLVLGSGVASAHPTLLLTEPQADTAVPASPTSITLIFNEKVSIGPDALVLLDSAGRRQAISGVEHVRDGRGVTARPAAALRAGSYSLRWRVTGTDGDLVEDEFRFGIGYTVDGAGTSARGSTAWSTAAWRWLLFAGFAVAIGGAVAARFTESARAENPRLQVVRPWLAEVLVVALAGVVGLGVQAVVSANAGNVLWRSDSGRVIAIEALALLFALAAVAGGRRSWVIVPLLAVAVAEGWRSHAQIALYGWGGLLTTIHVVAAGVWVGALVHTVRAVGVWRGNSAAVRWVLMGYLRLAAVTFALVIASGFASALILLPMSRVFTSSYGRILVLKLVLVTLAAACAVVGRRIQRGEPRTPRLISVMRAESFTLAIVLMLSATLVSTAPVTGTSVEPAPPPPPRGPVLPLGLLVGRIGVTLDASDGQLVVRLAAPRRGDYYAAEADRHYTLSARIAAPDHRAATPDFRTCGSGCFVASADWSVGENLVSVSAGADGEPATAAGVFVAWPPTPGDSELARAVAATRSAGQVTVYESVTSDTTTPAPDPQPLLLASDFFVAQEPFADGTATQAVRLPEAPGGRRLALGYPATSMSVLLTLDGHDRITSETLTDSSHLITRRIVYSDGG
ncbi:copper resistance protein CopC [Nocardia nova]|uniref:copper resistance CopC/CopD family protein n=1 Tax=Nocardia nova TaxID=37330 RepID=UPI0037B74C80